MSVREGEFGQGKEREGRKQFFFKGEAREKHLYNEESDFHPKKVEKGCTNYEDAMQRNEGKGIVWVRLSGEAQELHMQKRRTRIRV